MKVERQSEFRDRMTLSRTIGPRSTKTSATVEFDGYEIEIQPISGGNGYGYTPSGSIVYFYKEQQEGEQAVQDTEGNIWYLSTDMNRGSKRAQASRTSAYSIPASALEVGMSDYGSKITNLEWNPYYTYVTVTWEHPDGSTTKDQYNDTDFLSVDEEPLAFKRQKRKNSTRSKAKVSYTKPSDASSVLYYQGCAIITEPEGGESIWDVREGGEKFIDHVTFPYDPKLVVENYLKAYGKNSTRVEAIIRACPVCRGPLKEEDPSGYTFNGEGWHDCPRCGWRENQPTDLDPYDADKDEGWEGEEY